MKGKGKELKVFINPSSGVPIYIQIAEAIKYAIATGLLKVGDKLPAVRDLAYQAMVNPNTVAKAYQKLVQEGVAKVERGIGTFISKNSEETKNLVNIKLIIKTLIKESMRKGFSLEEIVKLIKEEWKSE